MTISIIIAVKGWQRRLEECLNKCHQLDYPDFEIIVLPDEALNRDSDHFNKMVAVPIFVIPTGPVKPAAKRDIALKYAKGEILAFLDDDAYPVKDWLKNAVKYFADADVAAVGGPAVTPATDSLMQQASGAVYSSLLVSGNFIYRYLPRRKREVDDYPSCNLLVRKSVILELGGFDTEFWPGEDTKLCLEITKKLKKKIIYAPDVLVYHHRRALFAGHLKQIANYALHRGYFVKKYPETSLKPGYFVPSAFVLFLALGWLFKPLYFSVIGLYLASVSIFSIFNKLALIPLVFPGIILTHLTYGFYFLMGLLRCHCDCEAEPKQEAIL